MMGHHPNGETQPSLETLLCVEEEEVAMCGVCCEPMTNAVLLVPCGHSFCDKPECG